MKNKSGHEYLTNVLQQWGEFCRTHRSFEKAIQELLAENERLKAENKQLKEMARR